LTKHKVNNSLKHLKIFIIYLKYIIFSQIIAVHKIISNSSGTVFGWYTVHNVSLTYRFLFYYYEMYTIEMLQYILNQRYYIKLLCPVIKNHNHKAVALYKDTANYIYAL
jgi:hypothetical protein